MKTSFTQPFHANGQHNTNSERLQFNSIHFAFCHDIEKTSQAPWCTRHFSEASPNVPLVVLQVP